MFSITSVESINPFCQWSQFWQPKQVLWHSYVTAEYRGCDSCFPRTARGGPISRRLLRTHVVDHDWLRRRLSASGVGRLPNHAKFVQDKNSCGIVCGIKPTTANQVARDKSLEGTNLVTANYLGKHSGDLAQAIFDLHEYRPVNNYFYERPLLDLSCLPSSQHVCDPWLSPRCLKVQNTFAHIAASF